MNPITIAGAVPQVTTDPGAIAKRDALLGESAGVVAVRNAIDYEAAGGIVAELKAIARDVERARKDIKAPVLELGKRIDTAAAEFLRGVEGEVVRIGKMLVDYDTEQQRIRAEAERKAREDAERAERARREAEAAEARRIAELKAAEEKAKAEAAEAIRRAKETQDASARAEAEQKAREAAHAAQQAEEAQRMANLAALTAAPAAPVAVAPPPPPKVAGLRIRQVQCHEVDDVVALYKARPDLVKLVPITGAINAALEAGETLPGVRGWKEGRA